MVNWYIQKDVFDPKDEASLQKALKALGYDSTWLTYEDTLSNKFQNKIIEHLNPVVFYGSINMSKLKAKNIGYPWVWINWQELQCTDYYNTIEKYLFNNEYFFIPWASIKQNKHRLYQQVNKNYWVYPNDYLFIRPNSNDKLFTGKAVQYKDLDEWLKKEKDCFNISDNTLCLVAHYQKVPYEVRVVVVGGKVISMSQYSDYLEGYSDVKNKYESIKEFIEYVIHTSDGLLPSMDSFTIDITENSKGEYKVLEVGAVNTSSWYDVDYEAVVKAISDKAREDWNDLYGYIKPLA